MVSEECPVITKRAALSSSSTCTHQERRAAAAACQVQSGKKSLQQLLCNVHLLALCVADLMAENEAVLYSKYIHTMPAGCHRLTAASSLLTITGMPVLSANLMQKSLPYALRFTA